MFTSTIRKVRRKMFDFGVCTCVQLSSLTVNPDFCGNYPYLAFLADTLQYDAGVKSTHLHAQGYYMDTPGLYDSETNDSWGQRRKLFLKNETEFRAEPTTIIGTLHTCLNNVQQGNFSSKSTLSRLNWGSFCAGLIPRQRLRLEIFWSRSNFTLWQPKADRKSYLLVPETAVLHVEVANLNPQLKIDLDKRFASHPIIYRFNDMVCLHENIGSGTTGHISFDLMKMRRTPLKIFVAFVKSSAFNGDPHRNPL
jgi:hypothetical protein